MDIFITVILFVIGIALIVKGGDFFVDAAAWIAEVSGIPKLIVGATIVSIATTLPEMLVSVMAALEGKVDMSIGNAVGSVTANLGLILAISVFFIPGAIKRSDYWLKSALMLSASIIIVICGFQGEIGTVPVIALLIVFAIFIYDNVTGAVRDSRRSSEPKHQTNGKEITVNIVKFILGAAGIVVGADLLVDNGSELAKLMGVSERIIGVTMVAIGTSLPELVTTITAVAKKQSSLSVGNILGANIIDLTLIMPLASIISGKTLPISEVSGALDLPACLCVGIISVAPALITSKFQRWQGVVLIAVYGVYVFLTVTNNAVA